jgi:hypothetical protein
MRRRSIGKAVFRAAEAAIIVWAMTSLVSVTCRVRGWSFILRAGRAHWVCIPGANRPVSCSLALRPEHWSDTRLIEWGWRSWSSPTRLGRMSGGAAPFWPLWAGLGFAGAALMLGRQRGCRGCGYDLSSLLGRAPCCPECGRGIEARPGYTARL